MLKLRKLIKEHTWDREFGDPLVTFEDVMKKHQVNKLKEDWWDDMDAASQAQYIKDHPSSKQAQQADAGGGEDDYDMGEPDRVPNQDFSSDPTDGGGIPSKSSGEEGGEQNIPSDDEIDSYQEKLNTYTGPYSDGNEIHTKWEGITTKVWAETSEEAYKDDPDHPLNKPSDSEWADTVGEEVKALASAHFSDFGDELKDASPEAKAYFKEKGLPPSDEQGRTGNELNQETLTIDGKQFRRISEGVEKQLKPKYEFSEFYQRFKR
jgi:hypothetical protein